MVGRRVERRRSAAGFRHEALVYDGCDELLSRVVPFVRDGVAHGEPVMVAMTAAKLAALRAALGDDADHVRFADMSHIGRNPGCIIPAWQRFPDAAPAGSPARGIGEPIWAERTGDELIECQLH